MSLNLPFYDRSEAGRLLAAALSQYANQPDVLVLALPRGGVPVAFEVAQALRAPLDIFVVRKLGVPGHEELAIGTLASGGLRVLNSDVVTLLAISPAAIEQAVKAQTAELLRCERELRGDRPAPSLANRRLILVDDGLATGASMRAAVSAVRQRNPAEITVAVPVAAADTCQTLRPQVDQLVCLAIPEPFDAVGYWYEDFRQTSDQEVRMLLEKSHHLIPGSMPPAPKASSQQAS